MITGDHIRMGRAALKITVRELAAVAEVTAMTITRIDYGDAPGVRVRKKR